MLRFKNRKAAGQQLAKALSHHANKADVLVLGLPRGGVPVAFEVARELKAELDVMIVRKLGVPGHKELAMGAIASGGVRIINEDIVRSLRIPQEMIDSVAAQEQEELLRREQSYRGSRPALDIENHTVIVIDDGIATGATMRAALAALKQLNPAHLVVAVPTGATDTCAELKRSADEVVCLSTPEPYIAVGVWYEEFPQTSDDEVRTLLRLATDEASQLERS